jgi:hypothetical protein
MRSQQEMQERGASAYKKSYNRKEFDSACE